MTRSRSQGAPRLPSPQSPSPSGPARWPDVLTAGLALAALGGLGALWWSERPLPVLETAVTAPSEAQIPAAPATLTPVSPAVVAPAPQPAGSPAPGSATKDQSRVEAGAIPPVPAPPPVAAIPPPVLPEPPALPAGAAPVTGSTGSGSAGSGSPPAGTPPAPGPAADVAASQAAAQPPAAQTQAAQTQAAPTAPRAGGAVATSERRTPLRSDYRVTLGTFGSRASAEAAAGPVEALGYAVYLIDLGDQYVAQVGPFADEVAGRAAQADIGRAAPRAELYPPRGQRLGTPAPGPAASNPAEANPAESPATVSAAPAPEAAPPRAVPVPSAPTYLQVGAFNSPEGAQRLVGLLRERGFAPSVNAPAGGKATVLVGPFSGEGLTRAEGLLSAAGFEFFRVR